MMATERPELCFGLVLLLEAAEYHDANTVTPPWNENRETKVISSFSPPWKPIHPKSAPSRLPPKKRADFVLGDAPDGIWLRTNPRLPLKDMTISPIKRSSARSRGSGHPTWELAKESSKAAASARRFDSSAVGSVAPEGRATASSETNSTFVLYDKEDDDHIYALHNVVRRDIWEGFVVNAGEDLVKNDSEGTYDARCSSRIARYDGTIGFRRRFCKNAPLSQRAEKSAVYPRSLERIYLANIRFQRDHVEHCTFIPAEIKGEYSRLKSSRAVSRGRKHYWVSSAIRRGLCNGENGIIFAREAK